MIAHVVLDNRHQLIQAAQQQPLIVIGSAIAAGAWVARRYRVGTIAASLAWPLMATRSRKP